MAELDFRISALSKTFANGVKALENLDCEFKAGDFVSILGPSGSGKSTLLRILAGLETATQGKIEFHSQKMKRFGFVFQDAHLLPWRNALENVLLPLELLKWDLRTQREKSLSILEKVGLKDFVKAYPRELSGGMRMRVSLARALVTDPDILLLDEPFAALDEITRQRLDRDLRNLWIAKQMTIIFVTHSVSEAVFLSNRALVLSNRPGRLLADIAIDLPPTRESEMKTSPNFVQKMREVSEVLERAEDGKL